MVMSIILGGLVVFLGSCIAVAMHWGRMENDPDSGVADIDERGNLYKFLAFCGLCIIHPLIIRQEFKRSVQRLDSRQKREEAAAEEGRQRDKIKESEGELVLLGVKSEYLDELDAPDRHILAQLSEWPIFQLLEFKLNQVGLFEGPYDMWNHCLIYKRFMFFKGRSTGKGYKPENIKAMYSPKVDTVWHTHLLYTKEYKEFCNNIFGHFVHHTPCDQLDLAFEEEMREWLDEYRNAFGEVPKDLDWGRYEIGCG